MLLTIVFVHKERVNSKGCYANPKLANIIAQKIIFLESLIRLFFIKKLFDKMQIKSYNKFEVKNMNKKKQKNLNQKRLLKLKIDKDLTWGNIEEITGYTRQNIDYAFKKNTQKTIQKVFEKLETV